ncbi:MAG: mechanosensitive ion channel [Candidatus Omnitrophica bacterium]|nr:mechanosensitive ion channel [Candidatus Omnitrophota bacterium]
MEETVHKDINAEKTSKKVSVVIFKQSIIPVIIGILIFAAFWFLYAEYGQAYRKQLDKAIQIIIILFATYWTYKIASALFGWYAANIARKTETTLDDRFMPLFRRISATIIWTIGLIILLSKLGVNINALIATLGIGSLAIALAAQDTISNIISGFLIMIDSPFSIGDTIKLHTGEKVKVLEIGIRRSKFLAEDNGIVIMPNLDLSKSKITNYSKNRGEKDDV